MNQLLDRFFRFLRDIVGNLWGENELSVGIEPPKRRETDADDRVYAHGNA